MATEVLCALLSTSAFDLHNMCVNTALFYFRRYNCSKLLDPSTPVVLLSKCENHRIWHQYSHMVTYVQKELLPRTAVGQHGQSKLQQAKQCCSIHQAYQQGTLESPKSLGPDL